MNTVVHSVTSIDKSLTSNSLQGLRILIIDDDELLLQEIQLRLEACNHEVKIANSGYQGIELLNDFKPQIVIIDWMMSAMDGLEVCRRIRQLPEGGLFYLMIMTQYDNEALLVDAFQIGVDDFLIKPITPKALTARISAGERLIRLRAEVERERRDSHLYLNTVDVLIICLDTDGNITLFNRKASDVLDFTEREMLGRNWFKVFLSDDYPQTLNSEEFSKCICGDDHQLDEFEDLIESRDGTEHLIKWNSSVIKDGEKVTGFLICGNDITKQRLAEQENERYSRQLQRAQKAQALSNLAGGISHNFNNILASIIGYTELSQEIMAEGGDRTIDLFLKNIHSSAMEAKQFVNSILSMSGGVEGKTKIPLLEPVLQDMERMLRAVVSRHIDFRREVDARLFTVLVDPDSVHQAVTQLCINAKEAMDGYGVIVLGLHQRNNLNDFCSSCHEKISGEYTELSVTDTGKGIPPEKLESIFTPFVTSKVLVNREDGLGLSVVHGIMHGCDGHIVVDSEEGKGTTFRLLFPVTQADQENLDS